MPKPAKINESDFRAIANRVRALRISTGLQQKEFAELYGFKSSQWSNFETGHSRISIDAALVLTRALRVPLDWIYTGETAWLPSGLKEKIDQVVPRSLTEGCR